MFLHLGDTSFRYKLFIFHFLFDFIPSHEIHCPITDFLLVTRHNHSDDVVNQILLLNLLSVEITQFSSSDGEIFQEF